MDSLEFARHLVDVLEDKKAEDIVLLDLRPDTLIADFFIFSNGNNDRHLRALADYLQVAAREKFEKRPLSVQGTPESGWLVVDFSDVVIHLFTAQQREYYNLDALWRANANVLLSIQ